MKKIFILLIHLFFVVFANGQSNYFNKILNGTYGPSGINSIVQIDSFYYVLCISVDTVFYKQNIVLLKINELGVVIDSNIIEEQYKSFSFYSGNSLIKVDNNSIIICGAFLDTGNIIQSCLIKFNTNLDTLWSKNFSHPDTFAASQVGADVCNHFTSIKHTLDNGFIITGNYNKDCITGKMRSYILKTDSLGTIIYNNLFSDYYTFYDIELASDSGFYIPTTYKGGKPLKLIKTDKNGNIEWETNINTKDYGSFPIGTLMLDSNTLINCSANWFDIVNQRKSLIVSKVDIATHIKVWEKEYFFYIQMECESLEQSLHIEKSNDGNIIIATTAKLSDMISINTYKGVLIKINPNGDSLWARNYGIGTFADMNQFSDMIVTDDGGILGAGFQFNNTTGQRNWIIKLDSFGCDTLGCQNAGINQLQVTNNKLKVYPNPANLVITIETFENQNLPDGFLQIFDILGKLVIEVEIPKSQMSFELNISELDEGLYVGRFVGTDRENWSFKFVKE